MKSLHWLLITGLVVGIAGLSFMVGRSSIQPAEPILVVDQATTESTPSTVEAVEPDIEPVVSELVAITEKPAKGSQSTLPTTVFETLNLPTDFVQTEALYSLAGRSDVKAIKRLINEADVIDIPGERLAALHILYLRFSELNPEAALAFFFDSGLTDESQILSTMFSSWAKFDLDAAISRTRQLKNMGQQRIANNAILQAYADRDPDLLQQIAKRLSGPKNLDWQQARATTNIASSDPISALEAAFELTNPNARRQAVWRVARIWAQTDAQAALDYANNIEDQNLRRQFRNAVWNRLAEQDPEAALAKLDSDLTQSEKQIILYAAMSALSQLEPQRALAIANNMESRSLKEQAMSSIFQTWAHNDFRAAAAALENFELNRNLLLQLGYTVSYSYANNAPQEALEWAERIGGIQGQLWSNVLVSISERDPLQALNLVSNMEPSGRKQEIMSNLLNTIANQQPLLAMDYLVDLPPGQYRTQTTSQIVQSWSRQDPKAALDWTLDQNEQTQKRVLNSIVYNLVENDLKLAAESTGLIPKGPTRSSWIAAVVNGYTQNDPQKAVSWIKKYRDESDYPKWVGNIAAAMVDVDPRAGSRLINTLTDIEQYAVAQQSFVQAWSQQDPKSAARWFSALPSEKRSESIIRLLASTWHRFEPKAAERWIKKLKTDRERDTGIMGVIANGYTDIEEFGRLVSQLRDPDQRQEALRNKVNNLAQYSPEHARELLNRANITGQDRADLISLIDQYQEQQW